MPKAQRKRRSIRQLSSSPPPTDEFKTPAENKKEKSIVWETFGKVCSKTFTLVTVEKPGEEEGCRWTME